MEEVLILRTELKYTWVTAVNQIWYVIKSTVDSIKFGEVKVKFEQVVDNNVTEFHYNLFSCLYQVKVMSLNNIFQDSYY